MPGVAIACDDCQVAVLMNQDEYEKQRNYGLSVVKCLLFFFFSFQEIIS